MRDLESRIRAVVRWLFGPREPEPSELTKRACEMYSREIELLLEQRGAYLRRWKFPDA